MRDDFTAKTKDILAKRVGFHCSNPACRTLTCGPRTELNKYISIGVASHITAASPDGPRYDKHLSNAERSSIENGLWLCQNCSKIIDNDPTKYSEKNLKEWKLKAERFALNKISIKTSEAVHDAQLLEQLSTFARISFEYALPFDPEIEGKDENYIKVATKSIYDMIVCSYIQTSKYLKRDKFVFALSLNFEIEQDRICFYGELITHLTPFGFYFGVMAEMLNQVKIDELIEYINSVPFINYRRQLAFGSFIPYKISRVNPAKIMVECNPAKFIYENGLISTSDLLIFLSQSTRKGITVVDDLNDVESLNKFMKLYEKIENGFDFSEVEIDTEDPENWFVVENKTP